MGRAAAGNGQLIGQCGVTWKEVRGRRVPEVGYLLGKEFWGRGYAIEAARACKEYAFDTLGFDQVYSIIRDSNLASQRVAIRNGMLPGTALSNRITIRKCPMWCFLSAPGKTGEGESLMSRSRSGGALPVLHTDRPARPEGEDRRGAARQSVFLRPRAEFLQAGVDLYGGLSHRLCGETVWCYVQYGHFESRKGLIYGPFSPVYGFGAVLLTLALYPLRGKNGLAVLPPARLSARLLNSCAPGCRKGVRHHLLGVQRHPLNLGGRTNLQYAVFWGLLGLIFIKHTYPFLSGWIEQFPTARAKSSPGYWWCSWCWIC